MSNGRPILAQIHRSKKIISSRHYVSFSNAGRRMTELCMIGGQPGDIIEFSDTRTGMQIGTMKLKVGGNLTFHWSESTEKINTVITGIIGSRKEEISD